MTDAYIAQCQLEEISAMTETEVRTGHVMTEGERKIFLLGFIQGKRAGLKEALTESERMAT